VRKLEKETYRQKAKKNLLIVEHSAGASDGASAGASVGSATGASVGSGVVGSGAGGLIGAFVGAFVGGSVGSRPIPKFRVVFSAADGTIKMELTNANPPEIFMVSSFSFVQDGTVAALSLVVTDSKCTQSTSA
jgi:hypothetical protein